MTQNHLQFSGITGCGYIHPRNQAQHSQFLTRVVGSPERSVRKTAPCPYQNHRKVVIPQIDPDLLHCTVREERRNGVTDRPQSLHRHSRRHPDHVGLSHPTIVKPPRTTLLEFVKKPVSYIPAQQNDSFVLLCPLRDSFGKIISHGTKWKMENRKWGMGIMGRFSWSF